MALASDTPVPTPTGWSTLNRLRPGNRVLDQEGEPCTVTAVCPRAKQDVFRIVFDDDFSLMAGARQPWVTLTHSRRFKVHIKRLHLSNWTSMLMPLFTEDIRSCPTHERGLTLRESMHSIPLALPLRLPERSLSIDPYLLGLWLGDGTSTAAAITCHSDDEPHYRSRAEAAGERWRTRKGRGDILTCVLTRGPVPLFRTRLNQMGVFRNKRVPMEYLRSGQNQRLALLQGLMDSDGYIDDVGGKAEFTSTSEGIGQGHPGTFADPGAEAHPRPRHSQAQWTANRRQVARPFLSDFDGRLPAPQGGETGTLPGDEKSPGPFQAGPAVHSLRGAGGYRGNLLP